MSEQVTLVVFKDNEPSKSFQISLSWLSRMGTYLWICGIVTFLASFYAVKYYRTASRLSPVRVEELEQELREAKSSLASLKSTATSPSSAPVPTVTVTAQATGTAAAPVTTVPSTPVSGTLFSAIPGDSAVLPAPETLNFKLTTPTAQLRGNRLNVRSAMQYTATDSGSQQGHIVILARGPETLLAYPAGVLNASDSTILIQPKRGEYFSVSRYREIKAEFSPLKSQDSIREVELMIFGTDEKLLVHERIKVEHPEPVKKAAPVLAPKTESTAPAPEAAPQPSSDQVIPPGTER